jgi:molybdopterin molybdotransferase
MKLLTVDTLERAREKLFEKINPCSLQSEMVLLGEANERILAEDIYVSCDIPGFRRAAVDGYALCAADTAGAGEAIPVFLKQTGAVSMGKPAEFSIGAAECACVPTGGMLPNGADAVVMAEFCENAGGSIAVYEAAAPGAGLNEAGEDIRCGELLLRKGTRIRPQEAGLLAAAGSTDVPVFSPLKLTIISTGDELVPPEKNPKPGEIRDINTCVLKAMARKKGYIVVSARLIPDDKDRLEAAVREALAVTDLLVISGGSSQGEKDITAAVINQTANPGVFTHGLALKPGKPSILGWDEESRTLLAGLPGHPVAAMMVFELIFGWLTEKLFKLTSPFPIPARISCNLPASPGRTLCQPVMLRLDNGVYSAEPVFGKSGMITTLTNADGYIIIDLNKEGLRKGEPVLVHLF